MKKQDRQNIFDKYGGRCAYCGCELVGEWQIDHKVSKCFWFFLDPADPSKVHGLENLVPTCVPCNHYKRSKCLESNYKHIGFRDYMLTFHLRLKKLPIVTGSDRTQKRKEYMFTIADKYGIMVHNPFNGKFYFETI